ENADDVDAVLDGLGDEHTHYLVLIMLVAQQVLSAEQHLQLAFRHRRPDLPQPFPRILVEIAQAAVEHRSSPALDAVIARLVHLGQDACELLVRQTCRNQRLIRVAQYSFGKTYLHIFSSVPIMSLLSDDYRFVRVRTRELLYLSALDAGKRQHGYLERPVVRNVDERAAALLDALGGGDLSQRRDVSEVIDAHAVSHAHAPVLYAERVEMVVPHKEPFAAAQLLH